MSDIDNYLSEKERSLRSHCGSTPCDEIEAVLSALAKTREEREAATSMLAFLGAEREGNTWSIPLSDRESVSIEVARAVVPFLLEQGERTITVPTGSANGGTITMKIGELFAGTMDRRVTFATARLAWDQLRGRLR